MKLLTTLLFLFHFSFFSFSQTKTNYKKFKSEIQQKRYSKDLTLNKTMSFLRNNEIYVSELIDICNYFTRESLKYKICLNAYPKIIDKRNFFETYNVFNSFSYAIKLYHNTQGNPISNTPPVHPQINYPNYTSYNGLINNYCNQPMQGYQFKRLMNRIRSSSISLLQLKQVLKNNCFSTKQVMILGEKLQFTNNRYDFFVYAFNYTSDVENFFYTKQLISSRLQKQELDNFIRRKIDLIQAASEIDNCYTSTEDFNYILKAIRSEHFSKPKLILVKKQIAKYCLNLQQIRTIANEFPFEGDRLDLLKYSFEYIHKKDSFYTLRDLLKFNSNQKKFDQFLLDKR